MFTSKSLKTINAFWVTVALTLGLVAVSATPASADVIPKSTSQCSFGTVCLYDGINYVTLIVSHYGAPGTCFNVPASANDKAESFYNHLGDGHHVQFYQDAGCTGHLMCSDIIDSCGPYPDGRADDFATFLSRHNGYTSANRTSSIFYNNG